MKPRLELLVEPGSTANTVVVRALGDTAGVCLALHESALQGTGPTARREAVLGAIRTVLDGLEDPPRRVQLCLRPPAVQVRTLAGLPPVRHRDLCHLVLEQRERFFRSDAAEPVVAARWLEAGRDDDPVCLAALADPELLDGVALAVAERGGRLESIHAARDAGPDSVRRIALATSCMRARERRTLSTSIIGATTLAVLGWMVPVGAYFYDLTRDERALREELSIVDVSVRQLQSLEARLTEFSPVAEAFRRQSDQSAWAAETLARTAAMLPPGLHLHGTHLVWNGDSTVEVHRSEDAPAGDSLQRLWEDGVRIEGDPDALEPYAVHLDTGP